jgi:hypothetical protein
VHCLGLLHRQTSAVLLRRLPQTSSRLQESPLPKPAMENALDVRWQACGRLEGLLLMQRLANVWCSVCLWVMLLSQGPG